ncbi:MAG TPA: hypothetical protein VNL71_10185 [Chloroflexota bacterium]|nr:hypothetical protein [Chloroflexota bacterium]
MRAAPIATFGTPLDITDAELVIESFFPADPETAAILSAGQAEAITSSSPGSP